MEERFSRLAHWTAARLGKPSSFALACLTVLVWAAAGPFFHYSDTWQLLINTATTIITFLMVFLLQHTQTRDTRLIQDKLDALIRASGELCRSPPPIETLSEADLRRIEAACAALCRGRAATGKASDPQP